MTDIEKCNGTTTVDNCFVKLIERVSAIETEIEVRFQERDKARDLARDNLRREVELARHQLKTEIELARQVHDKERERTQEQIQYKLDIQNNYQKKIDRLENTFAPTKYVDDAAAVVSEKITRMETSLKENQLNNHKMQDHKIEALSRVVYIGFGIMIGLQFVFGLIVMILRHLGI
jgi:hypothetical protein